VLAVLTANVGSKRSILYGLFGTERSSRAHSTLAEVIHPDAQDKTITNGKVIISSKN
jgi:hypothetical protein